MISYDLKCRDHDHRFEGWFASSTDFSDQLAKGWLACPICGSGQIEKLLSVPNVGAKSNQSVTTPAPSEAPAAVMHAPPTLPAPVQIALAKLAEAQADALKSSQWVGDKLVDEVRAQHYGETDAKPVHGEATPKEAAELAEEGIAIMPILFPVVPDHKRN